MRRCCRCIIFLDRFVPREVVLKACCVEILSYCIALLVNTVGPVQWLNEGAYNRSLVNWLGGLWSQVVCGTTESATVVVFCWWHTIVRSYRHLSVIHKLHCTYIFMLALCAFIKSHRLGNVCCRNILRLSQKGNLSCGIYSTANDYHNK